MKQKNRILAALLTFTMILSVSVTAMTTVLSASGGDSFGGLKGDSRKCGDVNGDGKVAVDDAVQILMFLTKNPAANYVGFTHPLQTAVNGHTCSGGVCNLEHLADGAKSCVNPSCDGTAGSPCLACELKQETINNLNTTNSRLEGEKSDLQTQNGNLESQIKTLQAIIEGTNLEQLEKYIKELEAIQHNETCKRYENVPAAICTGGEGCEITIANPVASNPNYYLGTQPSPLAGSFPIKLGNGYEILDGVCFIGNSKEVSPLSCGKKNCILLHNDDVRTSTSTTDPSRNGRKLTIRRGINVTLESAPGTKYEGQIVINAFKRPRLDGTTRELEPVGITLNGVNMENNFGPAIYARRAKNVTIHLAPGKVNKIADQDEYEEVMSDPDEITGIETPLSTQPTAAIFSEVDLIIQHRGSLELTANYQHGIQSRDRLIITGGKFDVTVNSMEQDTRRGDDGKPQPVFDKEGKPVMVHTGNAFVGRDGLWIQNGTFDVFSGNHAFRSNNIQNHSCGLTDCPRLSDPPQPCTRACESYLIGDYGEDSKVSVKCTGKCGDEAPEHSGFIRIERGKFNIEVGGQAFNADGNFSLATKGIANFVNNAKCIVIEAKTNIYDIEYCDDCGNPEDECTCDGNINTDPD